MDECAYGVKSKGKRYVRKKVCRKRREGGFSMNGSSELLVIA